jgi:DNA adenine methylase
MEALIEKKVGEALAKVTTAPAPVVPPTNEVITPVRKPFLKWVGGKTQILDEVLSRFPRAMRDYHEPFVGGGSVLLALLSHRATGAVAVSGTVYASDLNPTLIGLYKNVQGRVEELIAEVRRLVAEMPVTAVTAADEEVNRSPASLEEACASPESYYYWSRARFNAIADRASVEASALFLLLNKTCFRGVYREGPRGFNVPYGHYKNPGLLDEGHLRAVSTLLEGVVFTCGSFSETLEKVQEGDFVYLDPPYAPLVKEGTASFVSYTADGFDLETHRTLFKGIEGLRQKKASWLMSNADVDLVKEAFPAAAGYETSLVSCRRAIHSKTPDARANEVLIKYST